MTIDQLNELRAGMAIPYGGNYLTYVSAELAKVFAPGDRLIVVQNTGDLLHIPARVWTMAESGVTRAFHAFGRLGAISDEAIGDFYEAFARRLEDDTSFGPIAQANDGDVQSANDRGRSTTRLVLSDTMRADMIDGLRMWREHSLA